MMKDIVVCVDGSDPADVAFDQAVEIAKETNASLRVITVVPVVTNYYVQVSTDSEPNEEQVRYHWDLVSRMVEKAKGRGVSEVGFVVLQGNPVDAILDYLDREPAELVLVGARGLSRTQRLLMGSVSSALVQHAKCSVMVAKGGRARVGASIRLPAARAVRNQQGHGRPRKARSRKRQRA